MVKKLRFYPNFRLFRIESFALRFYFFAVNAKFEKRKAPEKLISEGYSI